MHLTIPRDLLLTEPPFATVHLDASRDTEHAPADVELRYRAAREQLAQAGAPDRLLIALDNAFTARSPAEGQAGRFLIAADGTVLIDRYLPTAPPQTVCRLARLPYVLPLVTSAAQGVPHVVAVVDKIGADLRAVDADGATLAEVTVDGQDHPVHKVGGGGRSHRSIQSRTEETVHHNIAKVAAETDQLVRSTGARLLILAGAVEPRTLLRKALPDSCAQLAVEIESGSRTGGTDDRQFTSDIAAQIAQRWHEERDELVERFHTALGRADGLAVQGIEPTTAALRDANVESLLISDPTLNDHTVWTGDRPELVATDPGTLRTFGSTTVTEVRADEALPAAALAVGADIHATDEKLTDGVGALLRHN